ncbi:MAG: aminopeptidase P family protein, partial [Actinobacteria bacterium]|nr:aminopeptidase P family protein [Actinomycetota bacterium]
FWNVHEFGADQLISDPNFDPSLFSAEIALRALAKAGVKRVTVPSSFRVLEADYLRDKGIQLDIDDEVWALRRRAKTPAELEGIERAQRATDTAMLTAARMLREAEPTAAGTLRYEGEILTAEWVRQAMSADLLGQGAESEEIMIHTGDACLTGHDIGSGPICPDQSCIIDCFPRDRRTGVYTDMTRTFVPGTPSKELRRLHTHVRAALDIAYEAIKPGRSDAHRLVTDYFHAEGFSTILHHKGPEPLTTGFFHSLGHGVGLDVHERPRIGRRPEEFMVGDVIAIEPGLYLPGVGGVRLEDTVLVTDDGIEHFTDPLPYHLEP